MRIFIANSLLVFCIIMLSGCNNSDAYDHEGNSIVFNDYKGRWVVINYWAIWCKPCIEEIPELNHFAQQYNEQVVVLGVDFDGNIQQQLQQHIDKLDIQFPVLTNDPATTLGFDRPQVLPTTIIIDPNGQIQQALIGPQTEQTLIAAVGIEGI